MLNPTIKLSRQQLYDEIWQVSVAGVARKYNLNYSKLIGKCKECNIPFPPSGYWTRKNMGKDVSNEVVDLPESDIVEVELVLKGATIEKKKVEKKDVQPVENENLDEKEMAQEVAFLEREVEKILAGQEVERKVATESEACINILTFLDEQERIKVIEVANKLVVNTEKRLHPQLVKYEKTITEWKKQEKEAQSKRGYNSRYNKPSNEPDFFNEISPESQPRVMQILDAVFDAVETLGGKVNNDLSMEVKSELVKIRIAEGQDKIKHELTKQEARALVEYNDKIKSNKWASKPQIRKYDYVYNGKLRVIFGDGDYIRDNASEKLEDRLGDILFRIYEKSEALRIERERREEEYRKIQEESRRKEEARKQKYDEIKRTKELINQAEDYRIACEIRKYIQAVTQVKNMDADTAEWIEWAKKKADWYDPTIAATDEYLGKREHWKSKEEKDLDKMNENRYGGYVW
ncbi:hypothetical protein [Frisingicoccus sp.]|uniref:hypothetical protein n=1 Tax=Frisingicoccus sp. TaxID=1918627 RepID=UPI003AB23D2B